MKPNRNLSIHVQLLDNPSFPSSEVLVPKFEMKLQSKSFLFNGIILNPRVWQLFKSISILTPWSHPYSHIQGRKTVVGKNETVATYEGQAMLLHNPYAGIQRGTGTLFASETDHNVTWPF